MKILLLTLITAFGLFSSTYGQYDGTMRELATELNSRIEAGSIATALVTGFKRMDGVACELGNTLTLDLESALSELPRSYKLLDRQNLESLASEHKLDMQGMMDDEQRMREAGKLLKADIMVFGYFTYASDMIILRIKAIDIQTSEQVAVITRSTAPSPLIITLCKGASAPPVSAPPVERSTPSERSPRPAQQPQAAYNDPACATTRIGNFCLTNNGKVDIGLNTKFPTPYGRPQHANLLVRPGRTECFTGKPAGSYPYTLAEVYPRNPVYPVNNSKTVGTGSIQITPCGNGQMSYP
jgi:hypothetical protein